MRKRDWVEDFQHENGQYSCKCVKCENVFIGYKRRAVCKLCAAEQNLHADGASHPKECGCFACIYGERQNLSIAITPRP